MAAKGKIARYFKRNTGTRLNPLMSSWATCGAVVDIDPNGDVDFLGALSSLGVELPPCMGGTSNFPAFSDLAARKFTGKAKASIDEAIPLSLALKNEIDSATELSVSFSDSVATRYIDIIKLSMNIASRLSELESSDSKGELRMLRKFLRADTGNRVIGAVYTGTIKLVGSFAGSGDVGFEADAYDALSGELSVAWKRTNKQTLETTTPVPFAFDAWRWRHGRLRDAD